MEKIAFLFPGQGVQFIGMAKPIYKQYDIVKKTFQEANDVLGFDLASMCFDGNLLELNSPENLFPAILAASIAILRVYHKEIGIVPQFCAGHSLGEYSALTCAGVIKYSDALKIVQLRGRLSKEIVESGIGGMTIAGGIEQEFIEQACLKASNHTESVSISCFNSPRQFAISGHQHALQDVEDKIMEAGGTITPIMASAPFHCPLMASAAEIFRAELKKYKFGAFRYPVISNVTAEPYQSKEELVEMLVHQLIYPVRWHDTMMYLKRYGIREVVEMSPKNLLCMLALENIPEIHTACFGLKEDRKRFMDSISIDEQQKRNIPTVVTKCLAAAAAAPNMNSNDEEYQNGVVKCYEEIWKLQSWLEVNALLPNDEQMKEALQMLKNILTTKMLPLEEQIELFSQILDETGSDYEIADFFVS